MESICTYSPARHLAAAGRLSGQLRFLERLLRETPIVPLSDPDLLLFTKLESHNVLGGLKARSAFWVLKRAIESGELNENSTVVESSSGNFALALAGFCASLGLRFVPVIDPNINPPIEALLRTMCTEVIRVEEPDGAGGYLKSRLTAVETIRRSRPDIFWSAQYQNPACAQAHAQLTGAEIVRRFSGLDYMFVAVSTGGAITGLSQRLKSAFPSVQIVAVDVEGSMIFGGNGKRRHLPGIGSSIRPPLLQTALIDDVVIVSESDSVRGCHAMLDRHGLFVGGSTGAVFAAIERRRREIRHTRKPRVLFLTADPGTPYLSTIYSPAWVERTYGGL